MKKESCKTLAIVSLFAIAMGFLEAVVVIYLRKIYYPLGFSFPLKGFIEPNILGIEWVREFFTIVMLVSVACLAGKKFYSKFAYFLLAFSIWDIFYYVFLKLTLNWPPSFLTWDLLFLIPWIWIAPVLAPIICTILIIMFSLLIINCEDKGIKVKLALKEWALLIAGLLIILYTWLIDYGRIIFSNSSFAKDFFTLAQNQDFMNLVSSYIPISYNWTLFAIGVALAFIGVILFYLRTSRR
jgi:hypothetical protein